MRKTLGQIVSACLLVSVLQCNVVDCPTLRAGRLGWDLLDPSQEV